MKKEKFVEGAIVVSLVKQMSDGQYNPINPGYINAIHGINNVLWFQPDGKGGYDNKNFRLATLKEQICFRNMGIKNISEISPEIIEIY